MYPIGLIDIFLANFEINRVVFAPALSTSAQKDFLRNNNFLAQVTQKRIFPLKIKISFLFVQ